MLTDDFTWNLIQQPSEVITKTGACAGLDGVESQKENKGARGACQRSGLPVGLSIGRARDCRQKKELRRGRSVELLGVALGQAQVAAAVAGGTPIGSELEGAGYVPLNQAPRPLAVDFVATTMSAGTLSSERIAASRGRNRNGRHLGKSS